jgi:predicted transcriptional regulator
MVMSAVCDPKSFEILALVRYTQVDSQFLLLKTGISEKAFYSRMSKLIKAGIVSRKNSKYSLTSLGEVVSHCMDLLTAAIENYWRLQALDTLSILPSSEYIKTTKILLGNQRIATILMQNLQRSHTDHLIVLNAVASPTRI